ncbi:MAG: YihA family ribosome biogenesis GTP-binding protein [Clostridia bacterium]|nr:YihA family ribosome biogenesis GTP-binding protein [Clostridia bacterium]
MRRITSAQYILSAVKPSQYPDDQLPELALVGRSNVGKSAFINALAGRKSLARTSAQPGKTRTLNFYRLNDSFYLVDLPGYGFAKVSQAAKRQWAVMIETYLQNRQQLCFIIQLVDIRHEPTADDVQMYRWLREYDAPRAVIATKADKISRGRYLQQVKVIRNKLGMEEGVPLVVFSAVNGTGLEEATNLDLQAVE